VTSKMVFDVANACRTALIEILNPHAATWGAAELATWLGGPYRRATRWAPQSAARTEGSGNPSTPPSSDAAVRDVLAGARRTVAFHLDRLCHGDGEFVRDMMARELVVPRCDGDSGRIVPVDAFRMRLVDRILSLAAADCLSRPREYTQLAMVCTQCSTINFERRACEHVRIPPVSGIHLKRPEGTSKTG
jgi:hypothetical protein